MTTHPFYKALKFYILLAFLFSYFVSFSQLITTFAGLGFNGETGDGGAAINAGIPYPNEVCLDKKGNLYIATGNKIRKIDKSTGIISTVAGSGAYGHSGDGGPALKATLMFTSGVFVDREENIYITEYSGHRIRKVDATTGVINTIAGVGMPGYSGDGGPSIQASINTPQSVCADEAGNVYFADSYNSRIRKIDKATGIISTVAGTGNTMHSGDNGMAVNAGVPYPVSVSLDTKGQLYIVEVHNVYTCRVRKVDMNTGKISTISGYASYAHSGDGGLATQASLFDPSSVCVDGEGNIYIAQYDDSRIRKIEAETGIIQTVAGNGTNGFYGDCDEPVNAQMHYPTSVTVDPEGNLYIADNNNHRIRKVHATISIKSRTDTKICENELPFQWNGLSITASGTYTVKLKPINKILCDSSATLVLAVVPYVPVDTSITICSNNLPLKWKGFSLSAAGNYTTTIKAATGCDTLAKLTLIVNHLALSIEVSPTTCGTSTGSATVMASGKAPYHYNWNTIDSQTTATANNLPEGLYPVKVEDANGCIQLAEAAIMVSTIGQEPTIKCLPDTSLCYAASQIYTVTKPTISSVCGVASITYKISGATVREGSNDASGRFNEGENIITWIIKDVYSNQTSCQQKVTVLGRIPMELDDVTALPYGVEKNTVYPGYKPAASIKLTSTINDGEHSYQWNQGATGSSLLVSPLSTATYHLTVIDKRGCATSSSKTIYVKDIRCGNNFEKVNVCQFVNKTLNQAVNVCIDSSAVAAHLANGATLGFCDREMPELKTSVFGNPSNQAFSIVISSTSSEPIIVKLMDQHGKIREFRNNVSGNSLLTIGSGLQPGLYFLETIQGNKRSSIKLIKQ